MSRFGGGSKCGVCGKTVYMAEEVVAAGQKWHKNCYRCKSCNKRLDSTTGVDYEGALYCRSCHGENFGHGENVPQGLDQARSGYSGGANYGYGGGAGTLSSEDGSDRRTSHANSRYGGGDRCPRCGKTVYIAEKIVGAGHSFHNRCFSCTDCNKSLDSTTVCDKGGEIYCKACYGKKFGPRGVGFGQGAGTLTTS